MYIYVKVDNCKSTGKACRVTRQGIGKNNSVELVIAGEFGQVLCWVTKMRRCQIAEVSQQKWWRKLENWKFNTEVWPCVVQRKANALKTHHCWQKTHHTYGCCSCDLWIWGMDFIWKSLRYLMEIRWWFWTGRQWQSWEAMSNQVDNFFPQPTPAPSFWLPMLSFQVGEHSSPAASVLVLPASP